MGATLFDSYANETVVAADGDIQVTAEVAEATKKLNVVSLLLKPRIQTLQQTLLLLPVRITTVVDIMDAGLVKGPMVGVTLDSLGR